MIENERIMLKAIAYFRVSTERQGRTGLGLDAQKKMVYDFAGNFCYNLLNEYIEINSGTSNHRHQLDVALIECRRKKAVLLIARLDRLSRNVAFVAALMESGVPFIIVEKPDADDFEIHITVAFAQKEHKEISKRTIAALAAAKAKGKELGKNGRHVLSVRYRLQADAFARTMEPVIESLRQKEITSTRKIMEELNRLNIPSYKGGKWHRNTVHRLVRRIQIVK